MAPQEGKSVRVSRVYVLWLLIQDPNRRVAIISYAHSLARRWGREVRDLIKAYPELGLTLDPSTGAAEEWKIDGYDGGVVTVGIEAGLTGRPVDVMVIDDPIKDAKQADSINWREMCKEWWRATASSRLSGAAVVVLIMTRWHVDDLAGWLMAEYPESWHVINLPAEADHDPNKGEADILGRDVGEFMLSARGRDAKQWKQRQRDAGSRAWNALYQGRPSPAEGGVFRKAWWKHSPGPQIIEREDGTFHVLGCDQVFTSWDMTFKDTKGSDFVVGQVWGRRGTKAILLYQVRGRWAFTETLAQFVTLAVRFPQAVAHLVEDKANGPAVISAIIEKVAGVIAINPTESKLSRANAVAPYVEAGDVVLPPLDAQIAGLIEEAANFPQVTHDDQVDALTQALSWMKLGNHAVSLDFLRALVAKETAPAQAGLTPLDLTKARPAEAERLAALPPIADDELELATHIVMEPAMSTGERQAIKRSAPTLSGVDFLAALLRRPSPTMTADDLTEQG